MKDGIMRRQTAVLAARFVVLGTICLLLLVSVGCSTQSTTARSGAATQVNEGGQVTVEVTLQRDTPAPSFNVILDTHSVDLDAIDLASLSRLHIDGREVQAVTWDAPKGGHHRKGILSFPASLPDGTLVVGPNTSSVELVVHDLAGVPERRFQWAR